VRSEIHCKSSFPGKEVSSLRHRCPAARDEEVKMRLILMVFLLLLSPVAYSQTCSCGPDYCQGDACYPQLRAKKKASLSASYPPDVVGLLDRDGACVARVEQAPDGFSLMTVGSDGSKLTIAWDDDNERISRKQVMSGVARAYYKFN